MPLSVAKQKIDDLLGEFPFADAGRSKAVAVSTMFSLFAAGLTPREALRPVFICLANPSIRGFFMKWGLLGAFNRWTKCLWGLASRFQLAAFAPNYFGNHTSISGC